MHNIVTAPYAPIRVPYWGNFINHNLFPDSVSLAKAQKNNTDQNSIIGNPIFIDPASGNFKVAKGSPALSCGFVNFDMDKFGVVSQGLKAISKKVALPSFLPDNEQKGMDINEFMGMKVKNINTLGERSATGMSSESGILVIDVAANTPFSEKIRPNDVILSFDGRVTAGINDLPDQQFKEGRNRSVEVKVFRNQKEQIIIVNF
jgi:hypothetical protein